MIDAITRCNLSPIFKIRLENTLGGHYKFWEAQGFSDGTVRIRYGRIGQWGQSINKDRTYFERTAPKKLDKGYVVKEVSI